MTTRLQPFQLTDHTHRVIGDEKRGVIALHVRDYRRYHKQFGMPKLHLDASYDHYHVLTDDAKVFLCPVYKDIPTMGQTRISMLWRASIEYYHPASRWHPEEADELELCDSPSLIDVVHCASAILRLGAIHQILQADAMADAARTDAERFAL